MLLFFLKKTLEHFRSRFAGGECQKIWLVVWNYYSQTSILTHATAGTTPLGILDNYKNVPKQFETVETFSEISIIGKHSKRNFAHGNVLKNILQLEVLQIFLEEDIT